MSFHTPWILYLLWVIPAVGALAYILFRRRDKLIAAHFSDALRAKLAPPVPFRRFLAQLLLIVTGMVLALLSMARPQWGSREETVYHRGRDLVIALDVSRSMLARDVHPNRLRRAKADLLDLIREIHGDRVALIAFRGKANMLCPLTTDHTYLKQVLDGVDIDSAPRGSTDIGDAIRASLDTFESDQGSHKAMILISDGEDLSGHAAEHAQTARERGIPIFAVGLGDTEGAKIPSEEKRGTYLEYEGEEVMTRLDHETLSSIAKTTGGAYLPVGRASLSENTLGTIYRQHMNRITSQDLEESVRRRKIERFQVFLLPGLLCMLAGAFLSRGRLAKRARRAQPRATPPPLKNIAAMVVAAGVTGAATAQTNETAVAADSGDVNVAEVPPGRTGARKAQQFYRIGMYKRAAETFERAAEGATQKSQHDFRHNAAIAYFKAGEFDKAAGLLEELSMQRAGDPGDTEFALGVVQFRAAEDAGDDAADLSNTVERAELLREAGNRFQHAAGADPDSERAERNLAVVARDLPSAENEAHIAKLMAAHGRGQPFQVTDMMLKKQREIIKALPDAFTNDSPRRIELFEELAALQTDNADLTIPLKALLHGAQGQQGEAPDPEQLEKLSHFLDQTGTRMREAGRSLRDLKMAAYEPTVRAEAEVYGLWKGMAPYHPLLSEDMLRQTNVIVTSTALGGDATERALEAVAFQQQESTDLTRLFLERFEEAFPEGATAAPPTPPGGEASTNAPALTPEDRAEIVRLTEEAIAEQSTALRHIEDSALADSIPAQERSLELLKEIEELLPRQQNEEQQDSRQEQQQEQQQEQEQEQEQQEDQEPQPQDEQPDPQENQQEQREPQEDETSEAEPQEAALSQEEAERLLEKVLEREKEYLEEKRRRQHLQMPPVGEDW